VTPLRVPPNVKVKLQPMAEPGPAVWQGQCAARRGQAQPLDVSLNALLGRAVSAGSGSGEVAGRIPQRGAVRVRGEVGGAANVGAKNGNAAWAERSADTAPGGACAGWRELGYEAKTQRWAGGASTGVRSDDACAGLRCKGLHGAWCADRVEGHARARGR
jgi:hypothetical protein